MNCPECDGEAKNEKNHLSEDEYTYIITCTDCDFRLETMSNLAERARLER